MMEWFTDLKIKVKLMLSYLILCLLMLCVGVMGLLELRTMADNVNALYYDSLAGITTINDVKANVQHIHLLMQRLVLPEYNNKISSLENEIADTGKLSDKCMQDYEAAIINIEDKQQYQELQRRLVDYRDMRQNVISLAKSGNYAAAQELYTSRMMSLNISVIEQLDKMSVWNDNVGKTYIKIAEESCVSVTKLMIGIIVFGLILSMIFWANIVNDIRIFRRQDY